MPARRMFQQPRPKATPKEQSTRTLALSATYYGGEGLHTISGNLHRPLKFRSFLFWGGPATLQSTPNVRESQRWAERGCRILSSAKQPFLSLAFVSDLPAPKWGERHLTHTQAFWLLSHRRDVYTPFSHLVTTTGSTVCNEVLEFSSKG